MAKRCCWPVLCLLLAWMLRAEGACAQGIYPVPTQYNTQAHSPSARYATTNRASSESRTSEGWVPSDQTRKDPFAQGPKPTFASNSRAARVSAAQPPPVEYEFSEESMAEEVYPQESFGEIPGYGPIHPASESYGEEDFDDSYFGDDAWDEHSQPSKHGKFFHFLGTFMPPEGYWFRTSKNSPRCIGVGEPLKGTSWLNRPNSVSFFAGILNGDELISNRVDQGSALFGGLRLGWDFDHYWGLEVRAGWSSPEMEYPTPPAEEHVDGIFLCDASILYYPWGDSSWRPYGLLGMGMARFDFTDEVGEVYDEYLLGIPLGFGMKYMYHPNIVFRAEFLDNIACASSGLNNMNNLSFTLGMELRYGGKPRSYYPWQPAKYIW